MTDDKDERIKKGLDQGEPDPDWQKKVWEKIGVKPRPIRWFFADLWRRLRRRR